MGVGLERENGGLKRLMYAMLKLRKQFRLTTIQVIQTLAFLLVCSDNSSEFRKDKAVQLYREGQELYNPRFGPTSDK